MFGFITAKHLITCAGTIVSEFGLRVYFKAWWYVISKSKVTFLDIIKDEIIEDK